MNNQINLATSQPGVMFNGGYQSGAGGCNINQSSDLQIGTIQTHPRCHIDLFQRPFATVPYLGRGSVNPIVESQILQGEQLVNKKSVNGLGERSYMKFHQTPLLPDIKEKIDQSSISEGDVAPGWVRGGVPSRELTRDANYKTDSFFR
jgi:hypothetical protein